jgi:hypothetical protein
MLNGWQPAASKGVVDGKKDEAYFLMAMRLLISRCLVLAAVLVGSGLPVAAEDLDAALAAQKKKAQRRVYSEKALMADRDLTVPRTETEEDRALDKKLREMETKQAAEPVLTAVPTETGPVAVVPRPVEDRNWLTAAVLDELQSAAMTNEADQQWLSQEMERQKGLKGQDALVRENELVEKILREKTERLNNTPMLDSLKKYQPVTPAFFGNSDQNASTPSYITPLSGTPDPLAAVRRTPKKEDATPPIFSPAAARLSSALDKDPLRSTRPATLSTGPGIPARNTSSVFSYDRARSEPAPLSPIEKIKQSSPINRPNPFADDYMPEIKNSIWQ